VRPITKPAAIIGMVISVCLLIAAAFGFGLRDQNRARHRVAVSQMRAYLAALERYKSDCRRYPSTLEGLDALASNPGVKGWGGPYVTDEIARDPWGQLFRYAYSQETGVFEIQSLGADGKRGGKFFEADISSRNLAGAPPPLSPVETRARRVVIGLTIGGCAGLLVSYVLWGFAARRNEDEWEGA
jgi:general secretion pathway protein G